MSDTVLIAVVTAVSGGAMWLLQAWRSPSRDREQQVEQMRVSTYQQMHEQIKVLSARLSELQTENLALHKEVNKLEDIAADQALLIKAQAAEIKSLKQEVEEARKGRDRIDSQLLELRESFLALREEYEGKLIKVDVRNG